MWNKPREISRGHYTGFGYEISYFASPSAIPTEALESWKASAEHDSVLRNRGTWIAQQWQSLGVALSSNYAVVWFAMEPDLRSPQP